MLFRLFTHTQLMPVLESGDDPLIGGQAVIEGVMMRAPHSYCISIRRANGEIIREEGPVRRPSDSSRIWKLPGLRGLATLGQAMRLGMKALKFSADQALLDEQKPDGKPAEEPAEIGPWAMGLQIAFSLGFFIFLYKFVPLFLTEQIQDNWGSLGGTFGFSLVDGVIRLAIFLTFLLLISRMKDIRRVFQYHGAEHKVVFNFEDGGKVSVPNAQRYRTFHPRCGTSFLMVVMVVSILVYALVPYEDFLSKMIARVVLLPVIAGTSYEIIRFAGRRRESLMRFLVAPGLWLQRITTKEPSDDQVETSINALDGAMGLEKQQGGELVVA